MNDMHGALVGRGGRPIKINPDWFFGSVDCTKLSKNGAWFSSWALTNTGRNVAIPPALFLVVSEGQVILEVPPNVERSDISEKFGDGAKLCGVDCDIPLELIPPPLVPAFEFYAFDGEGTASKLTCSPEGDLLSKISLKRGGDFIHMIQMPSTRLRDPLALAYASMHALKRFQNDYVIACASLCVIGYRILEKDIIDSDIRQVFDSYSKLFIATKPLINFGVYLRWHTSLRLIMGYLAYQDDNFSDARLHFGKITEFSHDINSWPQSLTNILLAVFISGYLHDEAGDSQTAIQIWSRAEGILRYGSSVAQFQNFYAYGELANAVSVAQECYVAMTAAKEGGAIKNVELAPEGRSIDLGKIPGPIGGLVDARKRRS